MTKEEMEEIKKTVKFESIPKHPVGGQQCGIMSRSIRLVHEELEFDITINRYRSQHQNRELAMTLFELYLSTF